MTVEALQADLVGADAAKQLYDAADEQLGGLDILVNNAGSSTVPLPIFQTATPSTTS